MVFTVVLGRRTKNNTHELKEEMFILDMSKYFLKSEDSGVVAQVAQGCYAVSILGSF